MSLLNPRRRSGAGARPSRLGLALVATLLAVLSVGTGVASSSAAPPAIGSVPTAVPASSANPYSDPLWLPLRSPATISCVKTNCQNSEGDWHGYWAIDFLGKLGDPVYAAGAGVFHIGANQKSCSSSGLTDGVWGWVDHGGGRVTKYTHFDQLVATEGQLVTPTTVIGKMGHWGDIAPCTTNYLHFEVREAGVTGPRVEPRRLQACTSAGLVSLPQSLGVSSFDDLAKGQAMTPSASDGCIPTSVLATPAKPTLSVASANAAARLSWGTPPSGTDQVRVMREVWSPSLKTYGAPTYSSYAGTTTGATVSGLTNARTYRFTIALHNPQGYSAWATSRTVIPATVPSVPKAPRFLTAPTRDYAHYGWYKSTDNGAPMARYTTQVRCYKNSVWTAWKTAYTTPSVYYYNHRGLTGQTSCQLRVRAENTVGASAWSVISTLRKSA